LRKGRAWLVGWIEWEWRLGEGRAGERERGEGDDGFSTWKGKERGQSRLFKTQNYQNTECSKRILLVFSIVS
jgi:hypothetical protein